MRRALGQQAEAFACSALEQAGYQVVERNWRCPTGEVDIVAQHREDWVFVEVRARRDGIDAAIESLGPRKRARMLAVASAYLDAHALEEAPYRIDLIVIELGKAHHETRFEIIEDALGW